MAKTAHNQTFTIRSISNAFLKTGIWPVNTNIFNFKGSVKVEPMRLNSKGCEIDFPSTESGDDENEIAPPTVEKTLSLEVLPLKDTKGKKKYPSSQNNKYKGKTARKSKKKNWL
jgi:hypothetical protein